ncbi:T9SS type A sorting domain-containing protein [Mariniflexile sp. AS56]|uniref:T9SS type A sorting domain-containing protein n=1 Tax=Mariniflexile sp. AS56 TaxID=3063957 RepID=UPI0026EE075C|nr:T9SS type A sorting domain-containing protein [Mariniflexile sp. AS56]MDO7173763.1 T9SS type A sorting domain-containing protein [Mariniflexile sp. AS56]
MKKITQVSMLFIALFFITTNVKAQSGDFEFLFETAGDTEGFTSFSGGAFSVAGGSLTFTYGASTAGFELNPPSSAINLDGTNFPYLAIQLSNTPFARTMFYLKTNGTGAWYDNKTTRGEVDSALNSQHIYFFDMSGAHFTTTALTNGAIERIIFGLDNTGDTSGTTSVNVGWIKTFASVQAIKDYAAAHPLSVNDIANKSQTKIITGDNKIDIVKCELNAKVQVFSLLGQEVHSSVAKSTQLSIPFFSKGVYVVKIAGETSVLTKKIILN